QRLFVETALSDEIDWIGYGGAPGSAKTVALSFLIFHLLLKYPGYQLMLLRQSRVWLKRSTLPEIHRARQWITENLGIRCDWTDSTMILEIHNDVGHGNSIMTCQEMQNPDAIQGASIDG